MELRSAKLICFVNFAQGYSPKMIIELRKTTVGSAERQLYILMYRLFQENVIERKDTLERMQTIMEELINPYSVTAKAFRYLRPLSFEL